MDAGDICFAHVRSFPWWPAEIVSKIKKGSKTKFSVVFFGTNETAILPWVEVSPVTKLSIKKYVTEAALRRKYYKEAYAMLLNRHACDKKIQLLTKSCARIAVADSNVKKFVTDKSKKAKSNGSSTINPEGRDFPCKDCKESFSSEIDLKTHTADKHENVGFGNKESFLSSFQLIPVQSDADSNDIDLIEQESVVTTVTNEDDFDLCGNIYELPTPKDTLLLQCDDCDKTFKNAVNLTKHCMTYHREDTDTGIFVDEYVGNRVDSINTKEADSGNYIDKAVANNIDNANTKTTPTKHNGKNRKKDQKTKAQSTVVKTLQEDEIQGIKKFKEFIEEKEKFFFCKICKTFSTATKMRAKTHVLTCGQSKRKNKPVRSFVCMVCDEKFSFKTHLDKHHAATHSHSSYTCTKCLKVFQRRNSYLQHLKRHKEKPECICTDVSCGKIFRYKSDLNRHMKTHNKKPLQTDFECEYSEDWRRFAIDLDEGPLSGTLAITEVNISEANYKRNFTSFESSLGFKDLQSWNDFVEISNCLQLPLSNDQYGGSVQSCIFKNEYGEQTVKFAWNHFKNPQEIIGDILLKIIEDTIEISTLKDRRTEDDELIYIIDKVISDINEKESQRLIKGKVGVVYRNCKCILILFCRRQLCWRFQELALIR